MDARIYTDASVINGIAAIAYWVEFNGEVHRRTEVLPNPTGDPTHAEWAAFNSALHTWFQHTKNHQFKKLICYTDSITIANTINGTNLSERTLKKYREMPRYKLAASKLKAVPEYHILHVKAHTLKKYPNMTAREKMINHWCDIACRSKLQLAWIEKTLKKSLTR